MSGGIFNSKTVSGQLPLSEKFNRLTTELDPVLKNLAEDTSKHKVVFMIDGSGSMCFNEPPPWNMTYNTGKKETLEKILHSVASLQNNVNAPPIISGFWGNLSKVTWHKKDCLQEEENIEELKKGLGCGTDITPALDEMTSIAAKTTGEGTQLHFILVSDGDIVDARKAKTTIKSLLNENSHITIDLVLIEQTTKIKSTLQSLVEEMKKSHSSQIQKIESFPEKASLQKIHKVFTNIIKNYVDIPEQNTNPYPEVYAPS